MKLTKKYILSLALLALASPMVTGCSDDDRYSFESQSATPSEKFNATIQYVSRLNSNSLFSSEADFTAVNNYMVNTLKKTEGAWLTILDRTDDSGVKKVANLSVNTNRWTANAFNKMSGNTAEGSTMIFNAPTRRVQGVACGAGCFLTSVSPMMNGTRTDKTESGEIEAVVPVSFAMNYRTVRFETQEQLDAFGGENGIMNQTKHGNMNMLTVGTVKNNLKDALVQAVGSADPSFRVYPVAEGDEYSIFMLCEQRFWAFTNVEEVNLANGITSYEVNVMW